MIILLCSCSTKREDYYNLKFSDYDITVGYDELSLIEDINVIDDFDYYINEDEEKIINKLVIYLEDLDNPIIYIDDIKLENSIKDNCELFSGELINTNGYACLISKEVAKRENYILLFGNILDDNLDELKRVELYYDK